MPATTCVARPHHETARSAASKVPEVTLLFWGLKILTTGFGEAASDALMRSVGVGGAIAAGLVLVVALVCQFRATRYRPALYWAAVAMVAVFGTMAADIPHALGAPLWLTSIAYLLAAIGVFVLWHRVEGTLSFASIDTRGREGFYWAAVLATFIFGTAVGDLTADALGLGQPCLRCHLHRPHRGPGRGRTVAEIGCGGGILGRLRLDPTVGRLVRRLDGHADRSRRTRCRGAVGRCPLGGARPRPGRLPLDGPSAPPHVAHPRWKELSRARIIACRTIFRRRRDSGAVLPRPVGGARARHGRCRIRAPGRPRRRPVGTAAPPGAGRRGLRRSHCAGASGVRGRRIVG